MESLRVDRSEAVPGCGSAKSQRTDRQCLCGFLPVRYSVSIKYDKGTPPAVEEAKVV